MSRDHELASKLFAAWQKANVDALQAERELEKISGAFLAGKGPVPDAAQQKKVKDLRKLANERLADALDAIDIAAGKPPRGSRP
jgi:hypothetical protein